MPLASSFATSNFEDDVPFLTSLTMPDGSAYAIPFVNYEAPPKGGTVCSENAGNILGLTLPTQGKLGWTYQPYTFPLQWEDPVPQLQPDHADLTGI